MVTAKPDVRFSNRRRNDPLNGDFDGFFELHRVTHSGDGENTMVRRLLGDFPVGLTTRGNAGGDGNVTAIPVVGDPDCDGWSCAADPAKTSIAPGGGTDFS
jgi:hypothetical protein